MGIDTSAAGGGVAVCQDDETLTEVMMESPLQHAEELLPLIDAALTECKMSISDIDLVSVNSGPGSFTGLRIGLATAKGMCQAAGIPLVGVDGWSVYRAQSGSDERVCVVIDNRRDLYYAQWFVGDRSLAAPEVISGDAVVERICAERKPVHVIGSGVVGLRTRLERCALADCAADETSHPSAAAIAQLGAKSFSQDQLYDLEPAYVEPILARMTKES